ncbi:MAG: hypothetical protein HY276_03805 [Ignavibacteriales bacterium]|nr:hypothetical protein [Bacteroidota bacterium]MBI3787362.1 hypothetical protein [Ignavibacteriales bacterium]
MEELREILRPAALWIGIISGTLTTISIISFNKKMKKFYVEERKQAIELAKKMQKRIKENPILE